MGPDAMIFIFWMLSFKPVFSLSSFTFIKRLFSSYLLSVIRVVSSAYLRLLIFLPAILIPASASSSLAFHMMYSVCKLDKRGDNTQPWHIKVNIQKTKIMASSPITSWQIYGKQWKTVRDYFGGSQITTDGDCSHEIKSRLLLGKKPITNLVSILKSRDITLSTKVHLVKAMVFLVVM